MEKEEQVKEDAKKTDLVDLDKVTKKDSKAKMTEEQPKDTTSQEKAEKDQKSPFQKTKEEQRQIRQAEGVTPIDVAAVEKEHRRCSLK